MSMNPRDRSSDPLSRLRFALETMPGSRKYVFTPATRAEILSELYDAFWGPYAHMFLPLSNSSLPMHATLGQVQAELGFAGAGSEEPVVPGRPCGHIFTKGESCFRCKDCALDESCVLCSRCFRASNHENHNVSFFIAQQSGGCCDCGDPEAWRRSLQCPYHPVLQDAEELSHTSLNTPDTTPRTAPRCISEVDIPPVPDFPFRAPCPPELRDVMGRTIGYALDFLLDTLDYSPDEPTIPDNEADLRLQPSADPMQKDQYCVILWNDDKHSFDEVIQLLCDTTNRDRKEAAAVAHVVDEHGREIIDMNANAGRLLEIAMIISKIELGVTVRRAYDTFREQVAMVIIEWLVDLTRSRLGADTLITREVIAAELLSPRRRESNIYGSGPQIPDLSADVPGAARIDWLFLYHTRLWKKPRMCLKEIYASILTLSHPHKIAIGSHFAAVYHRVIDAYLLVDREAETSIKYFALQLFTVPSVASYVVRHHDLVTRLLNIIINFFTNQIAEKRILKTTTASTDSGELDVESFPFKSKRFMPVFSDLRYLCHNQPVQKLIASNVSFIRKFAKVCQLFMCVHPNKRAATSHVEYETDAWISVFNVTLSLSRVIKVYGEAFAWATPSQLISAITTVVHEIIAVCTLNNDKLDKNKFSAPSFHTVVFGDVEYMVIDFDVLEEWVSFHHSLHWLLAELLRHVDILSEESLLQVGIASVRDLFMRISTESLILTMIDFPLRVLAMVAQIRSGLWVRNGFPIRGQLLHYRDFMLRELCYDQDLFILQTSLIILDPNTVFVSVLDRFGLLQFFCGSVVHSVYEGVQLSSMVEEVLYVIITLLTEKASASKMPLPAAVRREIIHALAPGPCSYTDLVKRVAERFVDDVCFEHVLEEVAQFRAPESTSDTGTYELRDELYAEVNPFYYHYARNRREEVEGVLRAWLKKKTGVADPVIVPKPIGIDHGPFSILPSLLESEVLLQVMFYAIYNILTLTQAAGMTPPSSEAILDQAFYLVMLALVERASVFSHLAAIKPFDDDRKNLIDVICAMEHNEHFKPYMARIGWILGQISKFVPEEVQARRKVVNVPKPGADAESLRKRAAKARQETIMAQMKAQQASFAINFEDEDEDEDEDAAVSPEENVSYGSCIVCQEDLNDSQPFGMLGFIQPSRLLRKHPDGHSAYLSELMTMPSSLDRTKQPAHPSTFPPVGPDTYEDVTHFPPNFGGFPSLYTRFGIHTSMCGHLMHMECFSTYNVSIRQRHRAYMMRNHPENILRKEFICPLCKSLGNIILPISRPSTMPASSVPFQDWIRAASISILKSKPDPLMDSLQFRNGTGEFVFWSAQDPNYLNHMRRTEVAEAHKMLDSLMSVARVISQQTRHLRDRPEPEPGERGTGIYVPEEVIGYTISSIEVAARGTGSSIGTVADSLSETQQRMIRGLLGCLTALARLELEGRPDGGRESVKQTIVKRLLPEWSRTSLTSFAYPFLLRDPLSVLVETAAVAPEMLQHVLVLCYYACLARTVVGMVYVLNKARSCSALQPVARSHADLFGDVRMFFMSAVRHSPIFEHTATHVFETFGEGRIEKMLYAFTLPFLRRAAILCRSVLPNAFSTSSSYASSSCSHQDNEYQRLLSFLNIPPLSELPNQDTLQNALSGWCAHYGHSHAASQLNCGVVLEYPAVYHMARLPVVLDNLFNGRDKVMRCARCNTVPVDAAICLICGATCCMLSNCCMDIDSGGRGECNMHMRECGGAIGLYFVVKRCSVLYLYANNGSFGQSPYLDVHGEVDISMRRGRRQYIHWPRWEEIRKTWLNHGIPTTIARKLESTVDNGGWETL